MYAGGSSPVSPPVHDFHTAVHSAGTAASPRATSEGFNLRNLSSGHGRRTREPAEAGGTELQAFDSGRYSLHCTQSVGVRHLSKPHLPSLPGKHSRTQQQSFVLWATRLAAEPDAAKGCSVSSATSCQQPGRPARKQAGRSAVPCACKYEGCTHFPRHGCSLAGLLAQELPAWRGWPGAPLCTGAGCTDQGRACLDACDNPECLLPWQAEMRPGSSAKWPAWRSRCWHRVALPALSSHQCRPKECQGPGWWQSIAVSKQKQRAVLPTSFMLAPPLLQAQARLGCSAQWSLGTGAVGAEAGAGP